MTIRLVRALLPFVLALLSGWLGVTADAVFTPLSAAHVYTYDGVRLPDTVADVPTARGSPTATDDSTYGVVDRWSHGASVRSGVCTAGATTTDAAPARLIQVLEATGTTQGLSQVASVDLSVLDGAGVAANSVRPAVTDARLGRALADDFRGGPNPIGDGSALDAARHTVDTGELVGGSTHLEKAVEMRDRYARILRRGGLSSADQGVAQGRYDAYSSFVIENDLDAMMRARGLR